MVQSTVGSSLANAITYLAGGKERDAALAGQLLQNQQRSALIRGQQLANDELQNQADLRAEREAVAPLVESGTIELNTDPDAVGAFKVNLDNSREGQLASLLNGSGALKTLNINTDEIEDLTFVDFAPAPGDRGNYVALVRNSSGEVVPMTVNATNDDSDPVMKFSRGQIERLLGDRVAVLAQRGAFQNRSLSDAAATRAALSSATAAQQERAMLLAALEPAVEQLSESNPAAGRGLTDAISSTDSNEDLRSIGEDLGVPMPSFAREMVEAGEQAAESGEGAGTEINPRTALISEIDRLKAEIDATPNNRAGRQKRSRLIAQARAKQQQLGRMVNGQRIGEIEAQLEELQSQPRGNRRVMQERAEEKRRLEAELDELLLGGSRDVFGGYSRNDLPPIPDSLREQPRRMDTVTVTPSSGVDLSPETIRGERPAGLPPAVIPPEVPATTQEVVASIDSGNVPTATPEQVTAAADFAESRGVRTAADLAKLEEAERAYLLNMAAAVQFAEDPIQARANLQLLINAAQTGNPGTNPDDLRRTDIAAQNAETAVGNLNVRRDELERNLLKDADDFRKAGNERAAGFMEKINEVNSSTAGMDMPLRDEIWVRAIDNAFADVANESDPAVQAQMADRLSQVFINGIVQSAANQNDGIFGWFADLFKANQPEFQIGLTADQIKVVRGPGNSVKQLIVLERPPAPGETAAPETKAELTGSQFTDAASVSTLNFIAKHIENLSALRQSVQNPR